MKLALEGRTCVPSGCLRIYVIRTRRPVDSGEEPSRRGRRNSGSRDGGKTCPWHGGQGLWRISARAQIASPVCIGGSRACPPEDCGSPTDVGDTGRPARRRIPCQRLQTHRRNAGEVETANAKVTKFPVALQGRAHGGAADTPWTATQTVEGTSALASRYFQQGLHSCGFTARARRARDDG